MAKVINSDEFQKSVKDSKGPVLVDFFATWCGPCKMLAPTLDKLSEEYGSKLPIYKLDIDQAPALAAQYQIRGVPCMKVFENGEVVQTIMGAQPEQELKKQLAPYVG